MLDEAPAGIDASFEAKELPASVADPATGLADVYGDDFFHVEWYGCELSYDILV